MFKNNALNAIFAIMQSVTEGEIDESQAVGDILEIAAADIVERDEGLALVQAEVTETDVEVVPADVIDINRAPAVAGPEPLSIWVIS